MLEPQKFGVRKRIANIRSRKPIYIIEPDGSITVEFHDFDNTDNLAYDVEQDSNQNVFCRGYANPVKIQVEDAETGDVKLMPSKRYKEYMKQDIVSQAMASPGMMGEKVKYMTMANMGLIVMLIIIVVAMLT